jgi:hypothetical protein
VFCAAFRYDASGKSGHASTPEQLDAVMHDIGSDQARYEAMLAWKQRKVRHQQWDGMTSQNVPATASKSRAGAWFWQLEEFKLTSIIRLHLCS